ncbi:hypothetical protein HPB52_017338 [Rhipicephalus sanguineus]|uniref:Uncharacterized protein n=1 Tax=Rhipicephalus sanguineus TaxID=34632 RepID=A0A9D4PTB5_RHISA|nr:hypothetical protein HPB52_017338 [Rhipicephalus sanguineus]
MCIETCEGYFTAAEEVGTKRPSSQADSPKKKKPKTYDIELKDAPIGEMHPLLSTKVKDKSQQPRKPRQKPGKTSAQAGGYGQEAKSPRTSKLSKLKDIDGGSFEGSNSPA